MTVEASPRHSLPLNRSVPAVLGWVPFAAYLLVAYVYREGGGAVIRQHDTLDFLFPVFQQLSLSELFSGPDAELDFFLGGLPRGFLGSEFHIGHLASTVLPLTAALVVTELITRTLAFVGMRLLFDRLRVQAPALVGWVTATLFSLLPFYLPSFGAVAGVPLIAWSFLRVCEQERLDLRSAAVAAAAPFYIAGYASIPLLSVAIVVALVVVLPLRRSALPAVGRWIGLHGAMVLIVDWRLFWSSLTGPTSHRVDMVRGDFVDNQWGPLGNAFTAEVSHAAAAKSTYLGLVLLVGMGLVIARHPAVEGRVRRIAGGVGVGMLALAVFSINWAWFEAEIIAAVLSDWARFQMDRVRWLEPTALYVLFGLGLTAIWQVVCAWSTRRKEAGIALLALVCLLQANAILDLHAFRAPEGLTIEEYFAEEDMTVIREAAEASGKDVVVVSVGIHPTLALNAGMATADGYWTSYPLEYKERFRALIAPHLDLSAGDTIYYDDWGSRAYLFQAYGRPPCCRRLTTVLPRELVVDPSQWEPLGITHVISSWALSNAADVNLNEVTVREAEFPAGPLYLYEVVPGA